MPRPPAPTPFETHMRLYRHMASHRPMRSVLARLGIDLGGTWWRGSEDMIARALHTCANRCPDVAACLRWLEAPPANELTPSFCPNARTIAACRIEALPTAGAGAAREPGIAQLLGDGIVQQLMSADHVAADEVQQLLVEHAPGAEPVLDPAIPVAAK